MNRTYLLCESSMMRVAMDTNLWSSIRGEETEKSFEALINSRGLRVIVPPSVLVEVVRIPVAEARQQVIHALATGRRDRLPTEAESESLEVVSEVKRIRPQWMRTIPNTGRTWSLIIFWTKKIWLFEVNRDGVSGRLPGVFSWRLRCVMGVLCRGCRRCGRACADWPGYGIRMPGGPRAWRAGSGSRRWRS